MTNQDQAEGQSGQQAGGITDPRLQAIVAGQAGGQQTSPNGQGAVVGSTEPREFEVDVGGVKRLVPMEQLVQAYNTRSQAEASRQAAEAALQQASQYAGVKELGDRIASLPVSQRARILQLLDGQAEEDPADRIVSRALGDGDSQPSSQELAELREMVQRQDRALQILAGKANEEFREKRTATLGQRVDQLMEQFPAFRGNPGAKLMAKDSIMTQLSHGNVDPDVVVQAAAAKLAGFSQQQELRHREELGVRPTMAPEIQKRVLTGPGLKAGAVRAAALDYLRRTQQA